MVAERQWHQGPQFVHRDIEARQWCAQGLLIFRALLEPREAQCSSTTFTQVLCYPPRVPQPSALVPYDPQVCSLQPPGAREKRVGQRMPNHSSPQVVVKTVLGRCSCRIRERSHHVVTIPIAAPNTPRSNLVVLLRGERLSRNSVVSFTLCRVLWARERHPAVAWARVAFHWREARATETPRRSMLSPAALTSRLGARGDEEPRVRSCDC